MAGRPTDYRVEYCEQVVKLCKLGAIDTELADFFEVTEQTINNWKNDYPEFFEAIKRGKMLADAEVAEKLFQRATGYNHPEVEIKVIDGEIVEVPLTKHYAPDTMAIMYWLNNRQRKYWKQKTETGFTDNDGNDVIPVQFYLPDNGRSKNNPATKGVSGEGS
jgi:cell fate (sporulation/competence/biofilm development) regulator YmcA (YheA/YmcA/DUF963 family)